MKLSRNAIWILVSAATISLAGLVWVQATLLRNAWDSQEKTFKQNAQAALASAVQRMESREIALGILDVSLSRPHFIMSATISGDSHHIELDTSLNSDSITFVAAIDTLAPFWFSKDTLVYNVPNAKRVILRKTNDSGAEQVLVDSIMVAGTYHLPVSPQSKTANAFMYSYRCDNDSLVMELSHTEGAGPIVNAVSSSGKQKIVRQVLDKLVTAEFMPVERRIDTTQLDSILRASFADRGIDLDAQWGVLDIESDSLRLHSQDADGTLLRDSWLRTRLYPQDLFSPHSDVLVYFPEEESFVMSQVIPQFTATGLLMLIVVICFAYTIRTILMQRRFADLTVGFINNMTHEFKTPISTISLACQALDRDDVQQSIDQSSRYRAMIRIENQRMKDHVDKILQMAVLEERSFQLDGTNVDIHALIDNALSHMALQVEQKGGRIARDFRANSQVVTGDATHLTNVIVNLLDNAVKYSTDAPVIRIATWNPTGSGVICIRIEDNGIGIPERDLPQVFTKYYRVATGDLHDVKGFGIGLCYVKLMLEAHGGDIRIESSPGKGTAVEFTLPIGAGVAKTN